MFVSTNTCEGKGECIKQCPTKAIRLINRKALSCLTCGLCYKNCPSNAIFINSYRGYVVDRAKCSGCGMCMYNCPIDNIKIEDGVVYGICSRCGICEEACPSHSRIDSFKLTQKKQLEFINSLSNALPTYKGVPHKPSKKTQVTRSYFGTNYDDCIYCGRCDEYCPTSAIQVALDWDKGICSNCGLCRDVCPNGSMSKSHVASKSWYVYLPSALMLALVRICGGSGHLLLLLGRLTNLFMVTALIAISIKVIPKGKVFVACLGLLPETIYLANSFSYDGINLGLCILLASYFYYLYDLFNIGQRPAVNTGLSVSRVGSAAQFKATKKVSSSLKMKLANFRELQSFSQFGSDLDENTKKIIHHGEILMEVLKQKQYDPYQVDRQVIEIFAAQNDYLDDLEVKEVKSFLEDLYGYIQKFNPEIIENIIKSKDIRKPERDHLREVITKFKKERSLTSGPKLS